MILLFAFLGGLFFNQLNIFKNIKIFYLIIILIFLLSLSYISIDVITGEGFTRSFWFHLQSDLIGATYLPYLLIFFFKTFLFLLLREDKLNAARKPPIKATTPSNHFPKLLNIIFYQLPF